MSLITFTILCNYHHYLLPKFFVTPKQKFYTHYVIIPSSYLSQPLVIFILFSVSMNFSILGISHKWNHTISVFLCLASFTEHNIFKVHSCCNWYQNFIPFNGWVYAHFVYPFICSSADRQLSHCHFLAIVNNIAMNIGTQVPVWVPVFNFF